MRKEWHALAYPLKRTILAVVLKIEFGRARAKTVKSIRKLLK